MSQKKHTPGCACCETGVDRETMDRKLIKEYGYVIHAILDPTSLANYHTHGLPETYGHMDLQIVIPLDGRMVHALMQTAVDVIKAGGTFEAGKEYDSILKGYKVTFLKTRETGREVLRMILPDPSGKLLDSTQAGFRDQATAIVD